MIKEGVLIFSKSRLAHPGGRRRAVPRIHGRGDDGGMLTCLLFRCLRFLGALRIRRRFAEWPVAQISEHFQTQTAFLVGPIFFFGRIYRNSRRDVETHILGTVVVVRVLMMIFSLIPSVI